MFFYKWSYQLIQTQKEAFIQTLKYFIINNLINTRAAQLPRHDHPCYILPWTYFSQWSLNSILQSHAKINSEWSKDVKSLVLSNHTTVFSLSASYWVIKSGFHQVFDFLIFHNSMSTLLSSKGHLVMGQGSPPTQIQPCPHHKARATKHHRVCSVPQL